jgi:HAD superfamily hydrolase (TIGR01450 family)
VSRDVAAEKRRRAAEQNGRAGDESCRAAEHGGPPAERQVATATAPLADVTAVFLDLDGCVWFGSELAPAAADFVRDLRASGRRVGFLSNTSNSRARTVAAKLTDLGVPADEADVLMPIEALAEHPRIASRPLTFAMGRPAVHDAVAKITPVTRDPERAELVVLSRDTELTYRELADAALVLLRGGALLALNLDASVPVDGGRLVPGTGAIAAALTTATGVPADIVGKPSRFYFEVALRRFGATAERTVMIGDMLDSDIAGGASVGMRTVLVGTGPASLLDPAPLPDFVAAGLGEARALLGI